MKTQKIVPIGRIFTNLGSYYLLKPYPLVGEREDNFGCRFLVVPFAGGNPASRSYPCPREVVFSCDFVVEYATDISEIQCELPYDVTDIVTTEIGY
jgi:hypothetical protein